ncbi:PREDICTED: Fanconi anemia core complex-associated protein 24-like [Priapulus caudatus]|uniref:Fanconi anemia core complex-associated protein 24-like n=1 Tax=Priapulus caudatus TaxID=37621 RepID=A0ABM1EWA9_PRICU|nr:PREDICTED: Fanconi anemia core complex-associated protein 24-like [Priapulus caudatus]
MHELSVTRCDQNASKGIATPTVGRNGLRVPVGHILVEEKWRTTNLVQKLENVNVLYEDCLGVVDFYPSSDTAVVYLAEADLVRGNGYRRKLVKLQKVRSVRGVILTEKTSISQQYYTPLQRFAVQELGLIVVPVSNQDEAAHFLSQLVIAEGKINANPFRRKKASCNIDTQLLATMQCIPCLGEIKARQLLERFHSIKSICDAPLEDVIKVVGPACAARVRSFYTST